MARAIETRCRWPPDSFTPRSPMMVSYFLLVLLRELIHARDGAGAKNFFLSGVRLGERHILANRAVEEKRILQHHAQLRAVRLQPHRREIDAIDHHFAFVRLVESGNQSDDGRLARSRRADQRRDRARPGVK